MNLTYEVTFLSHINFPHRSSNFPKATRSNSNSLTRLARRINLEKNLAGLDDASSNIADNPGYCTRKSADSTRKTAIISSNPTTAIFGWWWGLVMYYWFWGGTSCSSKRQHFRWGKQTVNSWMDEAAALGQSVGFYQFDVGVTIYECNWRCILFLPIQSWICLLIWYYRAFSGSSFFDSATLSLNCMSAGYLMIVRHRHAIIHILQSVEHASV